MCKCRKHNFCQLPVKHIFWCNTILVNSHKGIYSSIKISISVENITSVESHRGVYSSGRKHTVCPKKTATSGFYEVLALFLRLQLV